MYKVVVTSYAERDLKRLDRSTKNRILPVALALSENPRQHGCLKVKGEERRWRIRVGDWRIGYEIDDETRGEDSNDWSSARVLWVTVYMICFSQPDEERFFNERHPKLLELLPSLNDTLDNVLALETDKNGRFTPIDFNNPKERNMADIAAHQGLAFLILMLQLEVEHYGRTPRPKYSSS